MFGASLCIPSTFRFIARPLHLSSPSSCSDCLSPLSPLSVPLPPSRPLAHLGEIRPHQCVIRCETRDANGDMLSSYIGRGSHCHATHCVHVAGGGIDLDRLYLLEGHNYIPKWFREIISFGKDLKGVSELEFARFTQPLTVTFPA